MGSRNLGDSDSIFLVWLPRKSKKEKNPNCESRTHIHVVWFQISENASLN